MDISHQFAFSRTKMRTLFGALATFLLAMVVTAPVGVAQEKADPVRTAQSIIVTFFPELLTAKSQMRIVASGPFALQWSSQLLFVFFGIQIQPDGNAFSTGSRTVEDLGDVPLEATFSFADGTALDSVHFHGQANKYREYHTFRRLVNDHPEWSDDDVVRRLDEAGAQFGSSTKDAFVNSLPPRAQIEALFGGNVLFQHADFTVRGVEPLRSADLTWEVRWSVVRGNTVRDYLAIFEPFSGKPMHLGWIHHTERPVDP
jgi:hypothetical protein